MIVLFTDFGDAGPYVGQIKAVLARDAPGAPVIDLLHDAPVHDARRSAYLLAALIAVFPSDAVFVCVVDPGVGGARDAIVVEADGRRFVGPDNGLFEVVLRRATRAAAWTITWRPAALSSSFHGRDLFAPVAAMIVGGEDVPGTAIAVETIRRPDWPDDLDEIVFVDRFGNAMTGRRAARVSASAVVEAGGQRVARAATFSEVPLGAPLWYENSNGLVEIAVNQGRASDRLGLAIGTPIAFAD
jgi:S-adenosylmethionine hydrolase